jgi:hypothetical protein
MSPEEQQTFRADVILMRQAMRQAGVMPGFGDAPAPGGGNGQEPASEGPGTPPQA